MSQPYVPRRTGRSQHISLRGGRYRVWRWNEHARVTPQRPPLLLMHGWMDVGASFQFVVDALADDRAIVAADWRGFGHSKVGTSDSYWFADYLGDLDALVDVLSPEMPIDLLGHSMGGNVVMSYAGVRPERIRRLINLEGFGLPQTKPADAASRMRQWLDELKQPAVMRDYDDLDAVAARLVKNNPRLTADKAAWLAPHWAEPSSSDKRWHILGDPAHKRVNPVLYRVDETLATWERITAPLLWVEGAQTDMKIWWGQRYTLAEFHQRLAHVAQVERHTLADCGHMLHHDQPERLASLIDAFLNGGSAGA